MKIDFAHGPARLQHICAREGAKNGPARRNHFWFQEGPLLDPFWNRFPFCKGLKTGPCHSDSGPFLRDPFRSTRIFPEITLFQSSCLHQSTELPWRGTRASNSLRFVAAGAGCMKIDFAHGPARLQHICAREGAKNGPARRNHFWFQEGPLLDPFWNRFPFCKGLKTGPCHSDSGPFLRDPFRSTRIFPEITLFQSSCLHQSTELPWRGTRASNKGGPNHVPEKNADLRCQKQALWTWHQDWQRWKHFPCTLPKFGGCKGATFWG